MDELTLTFDDVKEKVMVLTSHEFIDGEIKIQIGIRNVSKKNIGTVRLHLNVTDDHVIKSFNGSIASIKGNTSSGQNFRFPPISNQNCKIYGVVTYVDDTGTEKKLKFPPRKISLKMEYSHELIRKWLQGRLSSFNLLPWGKFARDEGFEWVNKQLSALNLQNTVMDELIWAARWFGIAPNSNRKIYVNLQGFREYLRIEVVSEDQDSTLAFLNNFSASITSTFEGIKAPPGRGLAEKLPEIKGFIIFVSYSGEDKVAYRLKEIVNQLENFSDIQKVYFWEEDAWGQNKEFMDRCISSCDALILFCSPNSLKSTPVKYEWKTALAKERVVLPVFHDLKDVPPELKAERGVKFNFLKFNKSIDEIHTTLRNKISYKQK